MLQLPAKVTIREVGLRDGLQSIALQAARALVFEGRAQPSGYTEPLLHRFRQTFRQG